MRRWDHLARALREPAKQSDMIAKSLNDKQIHALRLLKKSLPATEVIDAEDA